MIKKIVAQNVKVVIGADVHTKKHVVRAKIGDEITKAVNISPNKAAWESYLERFPGCEIHVIYEAGQNGYNLYDMLMGMNGKNGWKIQVHIAPPALVPQAPGNRRKKTDKRDSLRLIQAYEMNSFRPVVVPDKAQREERELVRTMGQIKKMNKTLKNEIHSLLKFHGIDYAPPKTWSEKWIKGTRAAVAEADTTGDLLFSFETKLGLLQDIWRRMEEAHSRIGKLNREGKCGETAAKLEKLTGIGAYSATLIATEVVDFHAFDNSDAFASYVGVVPGEDSSGERVRRGHITRAGNRRLRWIFVECAWNWIKYDPAAKAVYNRIKAGKKERAQLAIVAMARRLAVKAYHQVVSAPEEEKEAA